MHLPTKKRLKIAIVGPYPVNFDLISGGIEAVVRNLVQGLCQYPDFEVHVVTVDFAKADELNQPDGANLHIKQASQGASQWLFYSLERQWIKQTLDSIKPDIIHVHGTNFYGYAVSQSPYPTLVTVHGVLREEGKLKTENVSPIYRLYRWVKGYFNTWFEEQTLQNARYATIISPYITSMLERYSLERLYPIDNPIDNIFFELESRPVPHRVLFAGLIHRRKGIIHLLKAINQVRQVYPDVSLYLAGQISEAEYADVLKTYIQAEGLDSVVRFCGHLNETALYQAFQECQLLVLPSEEEVSPMVVQQAMAMGKPVVATSVGGVPYLIENEVSGWLVPYGDPTALAQAIQSLFDNPKLAESIGTQARNVAESRFKQAMICAKTRETYLSLVNQALLEPSSAPLGSRY
ncbi:MAG: glycosyltransferase family 4 protein [Leptolyngbyaceae cyanobacterium]